MNKDSHPELGPKLWFKTFEELIPAVRAIWPDAWQEGSTGYERSWWTKDETAPNFGEILPYAALIGHSWMTRTEKHWIRIRLR